MMYGDYYFPGEELDQMAEGGIPSRYKNMGFSKVGAKKKSTRPGKKWMVLAKKGDQYKVVHGGYTGMKDFSQHGSEKRKDRFWDRMGGKNSAKAKDPFSPLYWHKRFGTWAEGGEPQNPGFQALPPYVQAKIMANMMYGGDMYGMGGMPCYECGGQMKEGGTPKSPAIKSNNDPIMLDETDVVGSKFKPKGLFKGIRSRFARNINPFGYETLSLRDEENGFLRDLKEKLSIVGRVANAVILDKPEKETEYYWPKEHLKERQALLDLSMGQPVRKGAIGALSTSEYKPSSSTDKDKYYLRSRATEKEIIDYLTNSDLVAVNDALKENDGKIMRYSGTLGNYTLSLGKDDNGSYLSYYDLWDLNPADEVPGLRDLVDGTQSVIGVNPPEVYGRVYVDTDDKGNIIGIKTKKANNPKKSRNEMSNIGDDNMYAMGGEWFNEDSQDFYKAGGQMIRRADGSYSRRGLWDNIRANKGSGRKPTKEMLEQEARIRRSSYGGNVAYAQYGEEFNPPMGSELDEYDFQKGLYGDLYADSLEKIKPIQMDWTDYEALQGELEALNGMTDRQQKRYEKSPLYRKMFASGNVDKIDYMPGFDPEGGMAAIKNAMFTTYRPGEASGRFNPTLSTKRGSLSLRGNENSKLNPYLKAAAMIGKGVLNVGAFVGKNAKKNRALNEAIRENLTDNAFPVIPMGITGAMGNFDVFGAFRPDETHASRTYYNQVGGEIEMSDDQIRQLVALGAEIEILD